MKKVNLISEFQRTAKQQIEQLRIETYAMLDAGMHGALHDELFIKITSATSKQDLVDIQSTIRSIDTLQNEIEYLTEYHYEE